MNTTHDEVLEQRLRHALNAVAETVTEETFPAPPEPATPRKRRRTRRIVLGLGSLALPLTVAAAAFAPHGSEYVDTIPQDRIVVKGSVDGSRYLLVRSDRTDECDRPVGGVELVEEDENLLGSEWNTTGYGYGEEVVDDCGTGTTDPSTYLRNPALFNAGGAEVGDSFVWVYAVHPDVDAVRITSGASTTDLEVHEVDGAGYAVFEVPKDMDEYTSELLIDGHPVPGSQESQVIRRP